MFKFPLLFPKSTSELWYKPQTQQDYIDENEAMQKELDEWVFYSFLLVYYEEDRITKCKGPKPAGMSLSDYTNALKVLFI